VKYVHFLVAALLFIVSMVLVPLTTVAATTDPTSVKWHPGHYYTIMNWGNNNSKYLSVVYSELKATPALRGIQMRYLWAELEKSKGVYDFSSIDKRLAELTARNKRL
ncbi:glycoside hydrolase, partial [Nitrosomonas supralitoralis]